MSLLSCDTLFTLFESIISRAKGLYLFLFRTRSKIELAILLLKAKWSYLPPWKLCSCQAFCSNKSKQKAEIQEYHFFSHTFSTIMTNILIASTYSPHKFGILSDILIFMGQFAVRFSLTVPVPRRSFWWQSFYKGYSYEKNIEKEMVWLYSYERRYIVWHGPI